MEYQLNLKSEGDRYREYPGKEIIQIPYLLNHGRLPISIVEIMRRQIEVFSRDFGNNSREAKVVRHNWWKIYINTGDGCLSNDEYVKVVIDAPFLRKLKPATKLFNGAILLSEDKDEAQYLYDEIDAPEFSRRQIRKNRFETVWLSLARYDKDLLNEYRKVLARWYRYLNVNDSSMDIGAHLESGIITGRSWTFCNGDRDKCLSSTDCLDFKYHYQIGIVPETYSLEKRI